MKFGIHAFIYMYVYENVI